jgi:hypothetical protein
MHASTERTLLGLSLDTDLIAKIGDHGHTVGVLRQMSRDQLAKHYAPGEADLILQKIRRVEIPAATVESILQSSGGCCCVCADGYSSRPYQIHHATLYAETQDHSEANLILLCPNHHATIHAASWTRDEQIRLRERWYGVRLLAADAAAKGVGFPYAALDFLDYRSAPNFGDLADLAPLTPSTAAALCPADLREQGLARLTRQRSLVVIGESGSGKSSFAFGLAGHFSRQSGGPAFRYMRQQKNVEPLKELGIVLAACARPTVFIVDDANQWASTDSLEKLQQLAHSSAAAYLIITLSPDDSGSAESMSRPNRDYLWIDWAALKETVTANVRSHEDEIVARLASLKKQSDHPVGHGFMERKLNDAVEEAAVSARSVYDFIFKLRDPRAGARAAAAELSGPDASHQPVLIAAINQIAGFEQAVAPAEVAALCRELPPRAGLPPADPAWVESVFRTAVRRRHVVPMRGAFTTVHRRWAAEFIDECCKLPATAADTENLLQREFVVEPAQPERLTRLWSWLENKKAAGEFVHRWIRGLPATGRIKLAGRCMAGSLTNLGWFAHSFDFLFSDAEWRIVVKETFEAHEEFITQAVIGATPQDWYGLKELMNSLHHTAPDLNRRILAAWTPERAAALISRSPTAAFDHISWTLGGALLKIDKPWCIAVGQRLDWAQIRSNLTQVPVGAPAEVNDVLDVLSRCRLKLMRSMVGDFMAALERSLAGASLAELHVDFAIGPLWMILVLFPDDARKALSLVDTKRWALELEAGGPRLWRKLMDFLFYCEPAVAPVIADIFAHCDRARLLQTLRKYAHGYRYEFRVLVLLLRYTGRAEWASWANDLLPIVTNVVAAGVEESQQVLGAFHQLDPAAAQALANEYGIEMKPTKPIDFGAHFPEAREEYARRDQRGEEYDTEILQWDDSEDKSAAPEGPSAG